MTLLGLDLNATRARAVSGPVGDFPLPVPLDPPAGDLPLYISLERSAPEVGHAGLRLARLSPHQVCHTFLPHLGEPPPERHWQAGHHLLDSRQALALVVQRLKPVCASSDGVVLILPDYLTAEQARDITALAEHHGIPLLGTMPASLAVALAAYAEQAWLGYALVADIDDHALTLSTIRTEAGQAHLVETRVLGHLSWHAWKERLLNALADCCVLQSRRDPRDSPAAEQVLFEQIEVLLDASRQGRMIQLGFQGATWYQNLLVQPEQPVNFCKPLLHHLVAEVEAVWNSPWPEGPPGALLLTAAVGRLPGVVSALRRALEDWAPVSPAVYSREDDFGEDLLGDGLHAEPNVLVVTDDAPARAGHAVAAHCQRHELVAAGHLLEAPLPLPQAPDAGPARLHFQGQDYFLNDVNFILGSQPGCNLVFPADDYLGVSPRHCEIVFDHRAFMLFDRSRVGTLVNDSSVANPVVLRPGDWIRLGPDGPLLRFLGGTLDRAPLTA